MDLTPETWLRVADVVADRRHQDKKGGGL